jgi:hypothetical protein
MFHRCQRSKAMREKRGAAEFPGRYRGDDEHNCLVHDRSLDIAGRGFEGIDQSDVGILLSRAAMRHRGLLPISIE